MSAPMLARLIGLEGETLHEHVVPTVDGLPPPEQLMLRADVLLLNILADPCDTSVAFHTDVYPLERILGWADGGPLAIYRRRAP